MKCDLCNNPAVVHEVTVRNGMQREIHLCEDHAREAGVNLPGHQKIEQILTQVVISKSTSSGGKRRKRTTCPTCGIAFDDFKHDGTLGCPDCYETFERSLTKLIERSQNGGDHHIGKTPGRAGVSIDRQRQIRQLLKDLDDAVAAEQYERAATLRDELKTLEVSFPAPMPAQRTAPKS